LHPKRALAGRFYAHEASAPTTHNKQVKNQQWQARHQTLNSEDSVERLHSGIQRDETAFPDLHQTAGRSNMRPTGL
jgi:hypothetical protein